MGTLHPTNITTGAKGPQGIRVHGAYDLYDINLNTM